MGWNDNCPAEPEYAAAKIAVWWDMNDCPIPEGYDARRVRPRIERKLRKLGYFGPVSITAYGDQKKTKQPNHLLRGLSSTGVSVAHAIYENTCSEMFDDILEWRSQNRPPATMMLISDHIEQLLNSRLERLGKVPKYDVYMGWDLARLQQETTYNLLLAYSIESEWIPVLESSAEWRWKNILGSNDSKLSDHATQLSSAGMFYCKSCHPFDCQSLLSFRKHLWSRKHALEEIDNCGDGQLDPETRMWGKNYTAKPEYATAQIAVWWDMNDCPIPEGYDARRVRPSMEGEFKKLGYFGPVSITAYGDYSQIPDHLQRGLSSTGVSLAHSIPERTSTHMYRDMRKWQDCNPPPATMMFICDEIEDRPIAAQQQETKYNLFLAYSFRPYQMSVLVSSAEWLWDTLLNVSVTTRPLLQESSVTTPLLQESSVTRIALQESGVTSFTPQNCKVTSFTFQCFARGESTGMFYCRLCDYNHNCGYKSLDDFRKHLSSKGHALEDLDNPVNGDLDPVTWTWAKNYAAKPEYATAQIAVWWNMIDCPIPEGYDARWVRPSLEGAFKKLGYSGPVSITAYGDHKQTPDHLLRGLSSTGVTVVHTLVGRTSSHMFSDLNQWQDLNPPPATMMLITNEASLEHQLSKPLALLQQMTKYNLFLAYTIRPYKMSVLVTSAEWLWDSLLAVSETTRPLLQESSVTTPLLQESIVTTPLLQESSVTSFASPQKCSERGESTGMFYCKVCDYGCITSHDYKSLDDFRKHLSSKEHALEVDDIYGLIKEKRHERRQDLWYDIPKSKRLRKAFRTGFRLLDNHLRVTTRGGRPRAQTCKKVW